MPRARTKPAPAPPPDDPPLDALLIEARDALFNLAPGKWRERACFGVAAKAEDCPCTACRLTRAHARLVGPEGGAA